MVSRIYAVITAGFMLLTVGCGYNLIDKVTVEPASNLETIRVAMVFGSTIKSKFSGIYELKDYGLLFINSYAENTDGTTTPFEVGLNMNTAIFNDQDYVRLTPVDVYPNGVPTGLDNAVVEIRAATPIGSQFDVYGYVDILGREWLGTAVILNIINDQYFPTDLSLSKVFMRDETGSPTLTASVFGPTLNGDGTLQRAGGIMLLANVKKLLSSGMIAPNLKSSFYPEAGFTVSGRNAELYRNNPKALKKLERRLIKALQ